MSGWKKVWKDKTSSGSKRSGDQTSGGTKRPEGQNVWRHKYKKLLVGQTFQDTTSF
jgi:hypothetical protein